MSGPHVPDDAEVLASIAHLVDLGALFALGESGGKDGQAMRIRMLRLGLDPKQMVVVHASLGSAEWAGALEHVRDGAARSGIPFLVAQSRKSFADLVAGRHRAYPGVPSFPSAKNRQCTSDLKRDPIVREVRRYAKARGFKAIVTCMGLRAQESAGRRRRAPLVRSARYSTAGREWWEWLPVHHFTEEDVFRTIAEAGEKPFRAYALGNKRVSCKVCFMACAGDIRNGAIEDPENFAELVGLEASTGYTMHQSRRPLEEVAGITVAEARALRRSLPVIAPDNPWVELSQDPRVRDLLVGCS